MALKQAQLLAIYFYECSILSTIVTFNVSQSRAMIDRFCQDEVFELTYYIETLGYCAQFLKAPELMSISFPYSNTVFPENLGALDK